MRAVLQRVKNAKVSINKQCVAQIEEGIVLLLGINKGDSEEDFKYILEKSLKLRIFEDSSNKMNCSLLDFKHSMLIVPNFTIYADARKGTRPSFSTGLTVTEAEEIYNKFIDYAKNTYDKIETGVFKADMQVELTNDGPVTIILDSNKII